MHQAIKTLLRKLYSRKIIGGKHTEEKNCLRWLKNLSKSEQKEVYRDWEYCVVQLCWVLRMKKTNENHVSLNPRKLGEIEAFLEGGNYGSIL